MGQVLVIARSNRHSLVFFWRPALPWQTTYGRHARISEVPFPRGGSLVSDTAGRDTPRTSI
jgi:hypothetical protein